MHRKITLLILMLGLLLFNSCAKQEEILSDHAFALDTIIDLKVYHYSNDKIDETTIDDAFKLISSLENILSVHKEDSDVYNLKQVAGIKPITVDEKTYELLEQSIKYSKLSNGLFDITSGPLIDIWAIDPPYGYVPKSAELEKILPLIDYNMIEFQNDNKVMLRNEKMIVNLGAIAKGYIADEVKQLLIDYGVKHALINLGGNVLLVGNKIDGSDFRIGIQNPNDDRGAYLMSVSLSDVAVVSSGDYERFFEYEGKVYHHILNPKTGYPADTNIKQVSIVAPNSTQADGLSTSVLLVGLEDGIKLVESLKGVEAIFITKDKKIYITDGLKGKYEVDEDQMKGFDLVENSQDLY